uniref:Uncharacterized protein n=1 Tax=Ciona intestinalis TaxID=7719 RepID=H2XNT4_CIOIN
MYRYVNSTQNHKFERYPYTFTVTSLLFMVEENNKLRCKLIVKLNTLKFIAALS